MEQIFSYIIGMGAAVMMPIIFTILGVCIGIKFSKALKSGLLVGVGFVGLSIVTALLTSSLGPSLSKVVEIYGLQLKVFDMGWPTAAAVAYNTSVGALSIPVCLTVNIIMLVTRTTRTVNIDLWNYWHYAFIGAIVYFAFDNIFWGFFASIICYIITLVIADYTAEKFQGFYKDMDGISIPQPFCAGFVPFAIIINKLLDKIPGFDKLNIDAEGMKKKFGLLGEPLFLGILVGCGIGMLACKDGQDMIDNIPAILGLGIKMGAVMELIPRITVLFIEGLRPISDATRELIAKKFKGAVGLNIGMSPALVIGHPATLVVSLLLIPVTIFLAVILPGNQFLPLASLAGMFYLFPLVLPYTKGNVVKTFIVGLVIILIGLYLVTILAPFFTEAAQDVYQKTKDGAVNIPAGFQGGALDFAGSPLGWIIFELTYGFKYIGAAILIIITIMLGLATLATANSQVNYTIQTACNPQDVKTYDTKRLRSSFLMEKVMAPDEINVTYSMYDRFIFGGAMPSTKELVLETIEPLKAPYFLYSRELGVINIGGEGIVTVDGKEYELKFKDALYVGRGSEKVTFKSKSSSNPAKFYINSAPAHKEYKTQLITIDGRKGSLKANSFPAGKMEESNDRVINQLIVKNVLKEGPCQLQMGLTELKPGS